MVGLFKSARRRSRDDEPVAASAHYVAPADTRLYAIGDIHGCLSLLHEVHDKILDDAAGAPESRKLVVYLGDYVDRGPDSKGVIDLLVENPLPAAAPDVETVFLLGNHEAMMLEFMDDVRAGPGWLLNGGVATLRSYGVGLASSSIRVPDLPLLQEALSEALPQSHRQFLLTLRHNYAAGDYLFVHAGVRPGVPLEDQDPDDLIWIRDEFLYSSHDHGRMVVHGHTPSEAVQHRANRIGIDTGACFSGTLTCMVAHADQVQFLQS